MTDTASVSGTMTKSLNNAQVLHRKEQRLNLLLARWQAKLQRHQSGRLMAGLLFFASLVPLSMNSEARAGFAVPAVVLLVFIYLVVRTRNIARHLQHLQRLQQFVVRQKKRCLGQMSGRSWKQAQEVSAEYPMIRDLGLVGSHSLWTVLDETFSEGGLRRLLHWMSVGPLNSEQLQQRQQQIQALRPQAWFFTRLGIQANSNELNLSTLQIQEFLKNSFVGPQFIKLLVANLVLWVLTVLALVFAVTTKTALPSFLFAAFPLLSLFSLGSVGRAFMQGTGLSHHLSALAPLFLAIEKKCESSPALAQLCGQIYKVRPSRTSQKLDTVLGFVGTQTNPILHFILNAMLPWTVTSVYFLERLRQKMVKDFPQCVEELSEFEVLGSLLIFDKYQTQTYPVLSGAMNLQCKQVFHPLLDRNKAVANDFGFPHSKSLGLLTGSNMSGKSTFLRTMGINQILSNMGAPVFADSYQTVPMKVETCIEVSDSLRDGYSYFYAEVRRLRDILLTAATDTPVLYLIDEIFRGTNNRERQIGSRAVIQTLANEKTSLGFISTHDLELTVLEQSSPSVMNLHFREDIDSAGKMVFHYHLNQGPCPTTNALRIMAAEGIKVDEV
ncbi:MutS family DNA mismatch repair protein [Bdellovibrio bacteriovorus]|uniref:MutS-like mismatch repair protein, ATPases n=1 Tax=Bdellovibrio bacteriovorus (strain ATCC 15356 / DSM 50701 / NCIMB 9529 / HD100) TaxID=264462 RepID=Q6MJ71_BDEBA|nr:MutS family DNA mismatch repair protein [Bdellovibrio bacteriovorus]CAE80690.1 MutS-like mismatch repair protein, ATPases [Bdellovibrio bacteriovorus HD100]